MVVDWIHEVQRSLANELAVGFHIETVFRQLGAIINDYWFVD